MEIVLHKQQFTRLNENKSKLQICSSQMRRTESAIHGSHGNTFMLCSSSSEYPYFFALIKLSLLTSSTTQFAEFNRFSTTIHFSPMQIHKCRKMMMKNVIIINTFCCQFLQILSLICWWLSFRRRTHKVSV